MYNQYYNPYASSSGSLSMLSRVMRINWGSFLNNTQKTLNVINQSGEIKYFENDQGYISKSIVNSNSDTGEVTIQLKVSNINRQLNASETAPVRNE